MKLHTWKTNGYRSIRHGELEIDGFNIIIGKNNTGKSNIIKSLIDYRDYLVGSSSPVLQNLRTKLDDVEEVKISLEFNLEESEREAIIRNFNKYNLSSDFIEYHLHSRTFSHVRHTIGHNESTGKIEIWEAIIDRGWKVLQDTTDDSLNDVQVRDIEPGKLNESGNSTSVRDILRHVIEKKVDSWKVASSFRKPNSVMSAERVDNLDESGENLVKVLDTMWRNYPSQFKKVEESYTDIMEGVTGIRTPFVSSHNTTIMVDEVGYSEGFSLSEISAGSKEILTLLTKIVKSEEGCDLLMVEEPELHIHPGAQKAIFELLQEISRDGPQVVVTTHSDTFVDNTDTDNIITVRRDVETIIEKTDEEGVDELLFALGYEKSELYQSDAVAFVEGPSDQSILNEISNTISENDEGVESFEDCGVTLRPLGGDRMKKHGEELNNTLSHMRIPSMFIADADDADPDAKEKELGDEIGSNNVYVLDEYCIESYLLMAPEAIASAFNFDLDSVKEFVDNAEDRPNKASVISDLFQEMTDGARSYDKKEHGWTIARNIAREDIPPELEELIDRIRRMAD